MTPTAIHPCRSCNSYPANTSRTDALCAACGHAVDEHGATVTDAYAVECPRTTVTCWATWVRLSATLDELVERWEAFDEWCDEHDEDGESLDISNLPTFGGTEPTSAEVLRSTVWSWDDTRLLVEDRRVVARVA